MHMNPKSNLPGFIAIVAVLSLMFSACAPITSPSAPAAVAPTATPAPADEGDELTLEGVTWQLVEFLHPDGALTMSATEATLTFQDGRVGGNAGCNNFSADYAVEGQQLTVGQGMSTMMACIEPIMAQEQALLANLSQAASYAITEGQLQILDTDGNALLSFEQQLAASLTGVIWQATNYNNGREAVVNVLDGTEITALFGEDGALSGSAGCNNYMTGFTVDDNQIRIEPAATTMMMCAEPAGVMEQEAEYVMALETAATFTIQGDVLELRTAEDALVARYVIAEPAVNAGAAVEIIDVAWQWVETAYGDGAILTVDDPSKYTLTLQADGAVDLQVDCNRGGGTHKLGENVIALDVAVLTRMGCPEGTLSDVFVRELNAAATYVMDGRDLVLNLFADSGNMRFAQAQ